MELPEPEGLFHGLPQFFWNRVISYPDSGTVLNHVDQDMFTFTFYLATSYMNGKIVPDIAFAYDFNNNAYLIIPSLSYLMSNNWHFSASAAFHDGDEHESLWYYRNKDYVAIKIKYNWQ